MKMPSHSISSEQSVENESAFASTEPKALGQVESPWQQHDPNGCNPPTTTSTETQIPPIMYALDPTVPPQFMPQHTATPYQPRQLPHVPPHTREDSDRQPWRYRGYPAFSKWMASGNEFFVLRRFGDLNARVLLHLQDRIVRLEEELEYEDRMALLAPDEFADSGTFRDEPRQERERILDELSRELEKYNNLVISHSQLKARQQATFNEVTNVRNWLRNNFQPIKPEEAEFVNTDGDLIAVVKEDKTPLRRWLDNVGWFRGSWFRINKLGYHHYNSHFESNTTIYENDRYWDRVVTLLIMSTGLAMLIGPLWILECISNDSKKRLGVITAFVVGFTVLLSSVTVAKHFEVLAATAAYAAVLMVFLQFGSNGNVGSQS